MASFFIFRTVVFPGKIFTLLHQEPYDAFRKFNESDLEFQWMQFWRMFTGLNLNIWYCQIIIFNSQY